MENKSESRKTHSSLMVIVILLGLTIVGLVGVVILSQRKDSTTNVKETNQIVPTNTTSTVSPNDIKQYKSSKLSIQFSYLSRDAGQDILIRESTDTVYVYYKGTDPEKGQFVRVWRKDQGESLPQAVKKQFLEGYDERQCFVTSWVDNLGPKPSIGVTAVISFPIGPTDAVTPWWENGKNCPPNYTVSNGLAYFWTDTEHSDKYVFFSVGQYYIPADTVGTSWHNTFAFIE